MHNPVSNKFNFMIKKKLTLAQIRPCFPVKLFFPLDYDYYILFHTPYIHEGLF